MSYCNNLSDIVLKTCHWDNCHLQFSSYEALFSHLKEAHVNAQNPSLPRDCRWVNYCTYQTSEKKHLISHLRSHLDWRPYFCEQCNSRFKHEHEVRRHVDKIHKTAEINSTNSSWVESIQNTNLYHNAEQGQQYCSTNVGNNNPMNDYILSEIIAFALGFREKLKSDDSFKNHFLMMGLSLSIFEVPQVQLKRYLLDNFYQFLAISSAQTTGLSINEGSSANSGYSINNFIHSNTNNQNISNTGMPSYQSSHQQNLENNFYATNEIISQRNLNMGIGNFPYNAPCVPSNNFNTSMNNIAVSQPINSQTDPSLVNYRRPCFDKAVFESYCVGYRSVSSPKVKIESKDERSSNHNVSLNHVRSASCSVNDSNNKKVPPILMESKIVATSYNTIRHISRNDKFNLSSDFLHNPISVGFKNSISVSASEDLQKTITLTKKPIKPISSYNHSSINFEKKS